MSDTPRTDEYISPDAIGAIPSLCRQLERELAAKAEEIAKLKAHAEAMAGDLQLWADHGRYFDCSTEGTITILDAYRRDFPVTP